MKPTIIQSTGCTAQLLLILQSADLARFQLLHGRGFVLQNRWGESICSYYYLALLLLDQVHGPLDNYPVDVLAQGHAHADSAERRWLFWEDCDIRSGRIWSPSRVANSFEGLERFRNEIRKKLEGVGKRVLNLV